MGGIGKTYFSCGHIANWALSTSWVCRKPCRACSKDTRRPGVDYLDYTSEDFRPYTAADRFRDVCRDAVV